MKSGTKLTPVQKRTLNDLKGSQWKFLRWNPAAFSPARRRPW